MCRLNTLYFEYASGKSKLFAVPAVHLQSAFAACVHNICSSPKTRPDAIAVELGHSIVEELIGFLKQLKQGGKKKVLLPCMFGILKRNNFIHPEYYAKSIFLEKLYGAKISDIPPDVLSRAINYSNWSTIALSPADSIIEAVRCGLELNLPIYGVDLDDFANTGITRHNFEDPQAAHESYLNYSNRVLNYCDFNRDPVIDFNRELNMSVRLKEILSGNKKVLFTCGLAHWKSIRSLLDDHSILPFSKIKCASKPEMKRTIIHPSIAASFMEIIPQVVVDYEKMRMPVINEHEIHYCQENIYKLIRSKLDKAYMLYLKANKERGNDKAGGIGVKTIEDFENFVFRLTTVRQNKYPNLTILVKCAEIMMDDLFCRILTNELLEIVPDWVSEKKYPGLPTLIPSIESQDILPGKHDKNKIIISPYSDAYGNSKEESYYLDKSQNQDIEPWKIYRYINKKKESYGKNKNRSYYNSWCWPPCESLLYGIGFKAVEISNSNLQKGKSSRPFEGSIEKGINLKSTMRSMIRGEKRLYISDLMSSKEQAIVDGLSPDPMVFIFDEPKGSSHYLEALTGGMHLSDYVKDKEAFIEKTSTTGDIAIVSVFYECSVKVPEHLREIISQTNYISGALLFGNPCINTVQTAQWLESNNFNCCPMVSYNGIYPMLKLYNKKYELDINEYNWEEALILMAIPFATHQVTIIARNAFTVSPRVTYEALKRKIGINIIPVSNFSAEQVELARHRYFVRTLDRAGKNYPPETEFLLGQTQKQYVDLLPREMRKQLK